MRVVVRPYLFLRDILGFANRELELPAGSTIKDLLVVLRSRYHLPERFELALGWLVLFDHDRPTGLTILIDGRNISLQQGVDTILSEGSTVTLFPPVAGG
jgi:molybdopterin converting factor small subunit